MAVTLVVAVALLWRRSAPLTVLGIVTGGAAGSWPRSTTRWPSRPGTVKVHVNAPLAKLGVRDRVQATIAAYDLGLVRPNP